jgi:hypothetical protein
MKNYSHSLFSLLLFFFFFLPFTTHAYTFNRTLKLGDVGTDVVELQKLLNLSADTQVAAFGVGSKGQESTYFGNFTKNAVIKYQNKYKSEILSPSGLSFGTGFVGNATLKKLNNKAISSTISPAPSSQKSLLGAYGAYKPGSKITTPVTVQPQQAIPEPELGVYSLSEVKTMPGRTITLIGQGFDPISNTVNIGDSIILSNIPSTKSGTELSVTIPQTASLGTQNVWVSTQKGSTKNSKLVISLVIGASYSAKPLITSISPQEVTSKDAIITITGSGFTSNNAIHTTLGTITNISSPDTKTMSFTLSQLPFITKVSAHTVRRVSVSVANENGGALVPATFILKNE